MTQMRPRSSKVIDVGLTMSGSRATSVTLNPGGSSIFAIASCGDSAGPGSFVCPYGTTAQAVDVSTAQQHSPIVVTARMPRSSKSETPK